MKIQTLSIVADGEQGSIGQSEHRPVEFRQPCVFDLDPARRGAPVLAQRFCVGVWVGVRLPRKQFKWSDVAPGV